MPAPLVTPTSDAAAKNGAISHPFELLERGLSNARAGAIGAAVGYLDRAAAAADLDDLQRATLLAATLDCRLARGELTRARAVGEQLGGYLDHSGMVGAIAHHGRGELCAALNEIELAATHFARVPRVLGAGEDDPDVVPWRTAAALTAVRLGHRVEAAALAREHLTIAGMSGAPYPVALGLRTLATVDARADRPSLLRQAIDELDGVPAARLTAQVETDLAGLLLLASGPGTSREALALLRRAETYAGNENLWPLLGRVRRLLARLDEQPQPVVSETLASLTAAEQRVARLAAAGLTNRQIAHRLVVTVKAVEWHLSHVYRKLGISSRGSLASALGTAL
ncbi:helix-turn-helix transcriptional regulator [Nocardioides sp. YIM 152315]|uniref:helix-turn-helix domain-containing protein n=1 Tax=Nocardioides sp. YIM 152315 TaxID=3031760 RepID=UPI0023DCEAD4|nr:helix-turn-helix transcriptional regulator [Nocardioides sp. YIM 152315]MDF1604365.1 helix-turn-helix transcriptional regulator [Nocardioides sp. YIM 152315]